jgi:alpha-ketoglutarate-dependent taurine dioxygenase
LPALPIQYADYALWQREWLQGAELERQLAYWKERLAGAPGVLELPGGRPRPAVQSFRGARYVVRQGPEVCDALRHTAQREGVTRFMVLLAAFQAWLARTTGQMDLVVGTDIANRTRRETEGLIGFFVNLMALRTDLSGPPTFRELLRRVRRVALEAYAHQDLPFEKLVEALRPSRDLSRNPVVQVLFVMQNAPARPLEMAGLTLSPVPVGQETARFDLAVFVRETAEGLRTTWVYSTDLFEARTIARMAREYDHVLEQCLGAPETRVTALDLMPKTERSERTMEARERQAAQLTKLRAVRRKPEDLSRAGGVKTSYLRPEDMQPLVIEPDGDEIDLAAWARLNQDGIEAELLRHGAILFRGFGVVTPTEFEQVARTLASELFGEYGDLPREEVGGHVYGATPYPTDQAILFHHESAHMHRWPMKIWFCCLKAAEQGGETPIADGRKVYAGLDPALRERFREKKLVYVRNYIEGLDVSWQAFFRTTDRSAVEAYCRENGIRWEWRPDGGLRTRQVCQAVVAHPQTGELVFFNQIQLHHVTCLEPSVRESLRAMLEEADLPRNVYYGDGSPIEDSIVAEIGELYRRTAVSFRWREGDVLMLNNMLMAHSRNPYVGARKILVTMGDMMSQAELSEKSERG